MTGSDGLPRFVVVIQVENDAVLHVPLSAESTSLLLDLAAERLVGPSPAAPEGDAREHPAAKRYVETTGSCQSARLFLTPMTRA